MGFPIGLAIAGVGSLASAISGYFGAKSQSKAASNRTDLARSMFDWQKERWREYAPLWNKGIGLSEQILSGDMTALPMYRNLRGNLERNTQETMDEIQRRNAIIGGHEDSAAPAVRDYQAAELNQGANETLADFYSTMYGNALNSSLGMGQSLMGMRNQAGQFAVGSMNPGYAGLGGMALSQGFSSIGQMGMAYYRNQKVTDELNEIKKLLKD